MIKKFILSLLISHVWVSITLAQQEYFSTPLDVSDLVSSLNNNFTELYNKSISSGITIDSDKFFDTTVDRDIYFNGVIPDHTLVAISEGDNVYLVQEYANGLWGDIVRGNKVDNVVHPTSTYWSFDPSQNRLVYNGDVRVRNLLTDPSSLDLGDSRLSSGGRSITTQSVSTGNRGAFLIQLYDNDSYSKATVYRGGVGAQSFDIQTLNESANSGISETNFYQVVQNNVQFMKIRFKPNGGTVSTSFTFSISLNDNAEPIYKRTINPASIVTLPNGDPELVNLGNGVWEVTLENPSQFDVNFKAYIKVIGLDMLGGTDYNGSDGIRYGDASKSNFFPWLSATSIPIIRDTIATENFVKNHTGNNFTGYVNGTYNLTVKSTLDATNQFLIKNPYTNEISFTTSDPIPNMDYIVAYAGEGLGDEGVELVYVKVDSQVETPIGSEPLDPDYYRTDIVGSIWKGSGEKSDILDPIAFGSINEPVILKALVNREVSAINEVYTLSEKNKLKNVSDKYTLSEFTILNSSDDYKGVRYIKHTNELARSFSSTFNTTAPSNKVSSGTIYFIRHDATTVTANFHTLTINDATISTGTFNLTQAQADILNGGTGAIEVNIRLADSDNNTILFRDAGYIMFEIPDETDENTVYINVNGNDDFAGDNLHYPKQTISSALIKANTYTGHRKVILEGVNSWGDFINSNISGNVSNLIVDASGDTFSNVTLQDHATTFSCRHIDGNIVLGDQCELDAQTIGSAAAHTITFASEIHDNTKLKVKRIESTTTLNFSNLNSGSKVIIEIDHYEGDVSSAVSTIPTGVDVVGWINNYNFVKKTKSICVDDISVNEYPIIISNAHKIKILSTRIWHPSDNGSISIQFKKNGVNEGSVQVTSDTNISTVTRDITLNLNESFTANVTSSASIQGGTTIEVEYIEL